MTTPVMVDSITYWVEADTTAFFRLGVNLGSELAPTHAAHNESNVSALALVALGIAASAVCLAIWWGSRDETVEIEEDE